MQLATTESLHQSQAAIRVHKQPPLRRRLLPSIAAYNCTCSSHRPPPESPHISAHAAPSARAACCCYRLNGRHMNAYECTRTSLRPPPAPLSPHISALTPPPPSRRSAIKITCFYPSPGQHTHSPSLGYLLFYLSDTHHHPDIYFFFHLPDRCLLHMRTALYSTGKGTDLEELLGEIQ